MFGVKTPLARGSGARRSLFSPVFSNDASFFSEMRSDNIDLILFDILLFYPLTAT
jgi:hypothetical protein